jgi:hypothetical protein
LIISTDAERTFEKIQHHFMIKALRKLGIEGMCLNIIKAIYDKSIANIILNGEKLNPFKPQIRKGTRVPILHTPIQHSPGIPNQSTKARRSNKKRLQTGKKLSKYPYL